MTPGSMTLTVTFILKIANLNFVASGGIRVSQTSCSYGENVRWELDEAEKEESPS